jgi:hypothetical protein
MMTTPAVATTIATIIGSCDLDRLGLDIGDGDNEGALAHRREHQRGGSDLRT